jgi:hypothetical protein
VFVSSAAINWVSLMTVPLRFQGKAHRDQQTHCSSNVTPNSRLVAVSYDEKHMIRSRVIWDAEQQHFLIRHESFWFCSDGRLDNAIESPLNHGDTLSGVFPAGTVVDQFNQKLILPDGKKIDGPSGDIFNVHGDVFLSRSNPKKTEEKDV